jgi:anti-sigma-K factor RskA
VEEIKAYIESGILELYVMGDLSSSEKREAEEMAAQNPAIRAELTEIQKALEGYANTFAVIPAEHLREQIMSNLLNPSEDKTEEEIKPVPLSSSRSSSFYKYAFAACLTLLVMSIAALFVLYKRLQNSDQQLAALQQSTQMFTKRANYMDKQLAAGQLALSILRNPQVRFVKLAGTKAAPEASMMVAFNPVKKEVMIDLSAMKMPANDQQHQYQLWALVNGKPIDLGVFDKTSDNDGMKKMKAIEEAEAFAVTLEPRGGSINPTMEQMMVMGAI